MVKPIQGALDSLLGVNPKAGDSSAPAAPSTTAPAPSAPPAQSPVGSPNSGGSSGGPSFLAAAAAPSQGNLGNKTLLGT